MHYLLYVFFSKVLGVEATAIVLISSELLALVVVPSILLRRSGNPLSALSWLLTVFSMPLIGVFLWWIFGRTHIKRIQLFNRARSRSRSDDFGGYQKMPEFMTDIISPEILAGEHGGIFVPTGKNKITAYSSGDAYLTALKQALLSAEEEINLLYYIWKTDSLGTEIRDILVSKCREGVTVRIVVDNVGSLSFLGVFSRPLRKAGAMVSGFLPPKFWPWAPTFNFRNHRKLISIDGKKSFIGGMNIGDEYINQWRDVAICIHGPASQQLNKIFLEDFAFSTKKDIDPKNYEYESFQGSDQCAVIASGPDCDSNCSLDMYFQLLSVAKKRIWIQTPYFIPPPAIVAALRAAVRRGVEVKIILPQKSDIKLVQLASRSFYKILLDSKVSIFEYSKNMLHSKLTIVDDFVFIGSSNIDTRSFRLNFELSCLLRAPSATADFEKIFKEDLSNAIEIREVDIKNTTNWEQIKESFANLFSPMM